MPTGLGSAPELDSNMGLHSRLHSFGASAASESDPHQMDSSGKSLNQRRTHEFEIDFAQALTNRSWYLPTDRLPVDATHG